MSDTVRCPACRGAMKVPKLGGIVGECNTCEGKGKIKACDKAVMAKSEALPVADEIIKATAEAIKVSDDVSTLVEQEKPKFNAKNSLYKRKKA